MSEHIFRYRHNLRAGIIANIFAYLPEDILKRHIESDDINHINMLSTTPHLHWLGVLLSEAT